MSLAFEPSIRAKRRVRSGYSIQRILRVGIRRQFFLETLESRRLLVCDGFVPCDFGDAPNPYPTLLADDGARHSRDLVTPIQMGRVYDTERDGRPSIMADGDDLHLGDDEDGVAFRSGVRVGQLDAIVTVNVVADKGARLDAWVDFDGDGNWGGPDEQIADDIAVADGNNDLLFDVPSGAKPGTTFARFRVSKRGDLAPSGEALGGEIEDHFVELDPPVSGSQVGNLHVVSTDARRAREVYAADVDGDGDMDIISASFSDNKIAWYENLGDGEFGNQEVITTSARGTVSVFAADIDEDGDPDVLSASYLDDTIAWYENLGNGNFGTPQIISNLTKGAFSAYAADVDGDGDLDVISASDHDDTVAWYENLGKGSFGSPSGNQQVISTVADGARSVYATDVDGDGVLDVISASFRDNKIAWYKNLGNGNFGTPTTNQQVISTDAISVRSVHAVDLDGDGDIDVLSASYSDDKIAWYENRGKGVFNRQQLISTAADGAHSVFAADVDGDGDLDVLSASLADDKIAWYENLGSGKFGNQQVISNAAKRALSVYAADVDGDGDLDVLSASEADNKIAWYENTATDYGDAPDVGPGTGVGNYNTLSNDNGPAHFLVSGLKIGSIVDSESEAAQSATADGDDNNAQDDEDGITNPSMELSLSVGSMPVVDIDVTNTTGTEANLYGWIDFNGNGQFEHSERTVAPVPDGSAGDSVTLSWPEAIAAESATNTFARFRLSTDSNASLPTGLAADGEVEDYPVSIGIPDTLLANDTTQLTIFINVANANPNADTIQLAFGGDFSLNTAENSVFGPTGLPPIISEVVIEGNGQRIERDSGSDPFRLFYVGPTGNLTLNDLKISSGFAKGGDGGLNTAAGGGGAAGMGGAIFIEQGIVTLNHVWLESNTAQGGKGGDAISGDMAGGGGGGDGVGANGANLLGPTWGSRAGGGGGGTEEEGHPPNYLTANSNPPCPDADFNCDFWGGGAGGDQNGGAGGEEVRAGVGNQDGRGSPGGRGGGGGGGGGALYGFTNTMAEGGDGGFGGGGGGGGGSGFQNPNETAGVGGIGGFGGGGGGGHRNQAAGGGSLFAGGSGGNGAEFAAAGGGGGAGLGGAIFNELGTLNIHASVLSGNTSSGGAGGVSYAGLGADSGSQGGGFGGAVFSYGGTVNISGTTISENVAVEGSGGGVFVHEGTGGAIVTVDDSTLSGNSAGENGGAIHVHSISGSTLISNSTLSNNSASGSAKGGGGLASESGFVEVINSTISTNSAPNSSGGGIDVFGGTAQLNHTTVAANSANFGGGVFLTTSTLSLNSTIIADNSTTSGMSDFENSDSSPGTITSTFGHNLLEVGDPLGGITTNNITGVDPQLGPLQFNTGSTQTHALLEGSPAIDAGIDLGLVTKDQVGRPRTVDIASVIDATDGTDIGSFEFVFLDLGDAPDSGPGGSGPGFLEIGANDFQISSVGDDENDPDEDKKDFDAGDPAIAYNAADDEYLAVFQADHQANGEFEVFGQRIDATTSAKIGSQFRISNQGLDGDDSFDALAPDVSWNATDNEYLVVWTGDRISGEDEIYAQRLSNEGLELDTGAEVGSVDLRISDLGPDDDVSHDAYAPAVAWNAINNQYLIVWHGDDNTGALIGNEYEVFGQLLDSDGSENGGDFRISNQGPDGNELFDAQAPDVSWNATDNEYLVVWTGDLDDGTAAPVAGENEIFAQRLSSTGMELNTGTAVGSVDLRISDMGPDGDTSFDADSPAVAWNSVDNQFFVVWDGEDNTGLLVNGEFEIFGQLLSNTATEIGIDLRISQLGADGDENTDGQNADVAYAPGLNEYLVAWEGDGTLTGEDEIYVQRISASSAELGIDDQQISDLGVGTSFDQQVPAVAFDTTNSQYLVAWEGENDSPPNVDGAEEIIGQLLTLSPVPNYETLIDDNGPNHIIAAVPQVFMGANAPDSEVDAHQNETADGDDMFGAVPDDEDGLTNVFIEGLSPTLNVVVTNNSGGLATLYGWMDYNGDGLFQTATEGASIVVANGATASTAVLNLPAIPAGSSGSTFLRLRLSTDPAASNPTGLAVDGEVEDYLVTITTPPNVVQVLVGSSSWSNDFRTQILSANDGFFPIPTDGDQLKSVPWTIDEIRVRFSEDVNVVQGDLIVTGVNSAAINVQTLLEYDDTSFEATWSIDSVTIDKLLLNVSDSITSKSSRLALDGEFATGSGASSSGNGVPGGDFRFRVNVLTGDADRNGTNSLNDLQQLASNWQQATTLANFFVDFDGSNAMSLNDLQLLATNWQQSLPLGDPLPPPLPALFGAALDDDQRFLPKRHIDQIMADGEDEDRLMGIS